MAPVPSNGELQHLPDALFFRYEDKQLYREIPGAVKKVFKGGGGVGGGT
jgi:hypothetical protein